MFTAFCFQTALLYAAKHNQHLMVADLIYLGANVNETNNSGKSCLHLSAEKGFFRVLEVRAYMLSYLLYGGLFMPWKEKIRKICQDE